MKKEWRIEEGEEAHLTESGAVIWSHGDLSLRVRQMPSASYRSTFPGSAVRIGESVFEVVGRSESGGRMRYELAPWPNDQAMRGVITYNAALVRETQQERRRIETLRKARLYSWLLYPIVGLLPERVQIAVCERLGMHPLTATFVSGVCETGVILWVVARLGEWAGPGDAVGLILAAPAIGILFVWPAFMRAVCAPLSSEVAGEAYLTLAFELYEQLRGGSGERRESGYSLTRESFVARLAVPDRHYENPDGSITVEASLPHLMWRAPEKFTYRHVLWLVSPLDPELLGNRVRYLYILRPLAGAVTDHESVDAPPPTYYADHVREQIEREGEGMRRTLPWLVSMLPSATQDRILRARGGPAAVRASALTTAVLTLLLAALYAHLRRPPAFFDWVLIALLLAEALTRIAWILQGRYAPSLLGALIADYLPPGRRAYLAHRKADDEARRMIRKSRFKTRE